MNRIRQFSGEVSKKEEIRMLRTLLLLSFECLPGRKRMFQTSQYLSKKSETEDVRERRKETHITHKSETESKRYKHKTKEKKAEGKAES